MIFVAGATGFVGRHLLGFLKEAGTSARCLVRDDKKAGSVRGLGFEAVQGDITDEGSLKGLLEGVETVVHLVGILKEEGETTFDAVHVTGTQNLVNEAVAGGVKRFFYQSALGADPDSRFQYCKTKARAEQIVMESGISYTIFRPSLIIGEGDGFTLRTRQVLTAGPVVPVPGKGEARFQPLYIGDWVRCLHAVLAAPAFDNRTLELGGPEHLSYQEILKTYMKVLKIDKSLVHVPMGVMRLGLPFMGAARSLASAVGREIPEVTGELLSLLEQDNICEPDGVLKNFGFEPTRLAEALKEFLGSEE